MQGSRYYRYLIYPAVTRYAIPLISFRVLNNPYRQYFSMFSERLPLSGGLCPRDESANCMVQAIAIQYTFGY